MAVHNPDPQSAEDVDQLFGNDMQWTKLDLEVKEDRMPQYNGTNISSKQLAGTTADDGTPGGGMASAIIDQMDQMNIMGSAMKRKDGGCDMTDSPGSINSGATGGVETDRCRQPPAVEDPGWAWGRQPLTEECLHFQTRQLSHYFEYTDSPEDWIEHQAYLRLETHGFKDKKPPNSVVSAASSAWAPVPHYADIAHDVAGAGDWATDIPAPCPRDHR